MIKCANMHRFWRILLVMSLVGLVSNLANGLVEYAYSEMEIQTWADHFVAKAQAMREGMEYAVPSSIVARQMSIATISVGLSSPSLDSDRCECPELKA